jgi:ferredoxin
MKKLSLLLILLIITVIVISAVAYEDAVSSELTTYTGTYKLDKGKPSLLKDKAQKLLLLAPSAAMDTLGINLSDGDQLIVHGALTQGAILVTRIQRGEEFFSLRADDLSSNFYDEPSTVIVTPAKCIGCKLCVPNCPVGAITMIKGKAVIDSTKCVSCGICIDGNGKFRGCPVRAINK